MVCHYCHSSAGSRGVCRLSIAWLAIGVPHSCRSCVACHKYSPCACACLHALSVSTCIQPAWGGVHTTLGLTLLSAQHTSDGCFCQPVHFVSHSVPGCAASCLGYHTAYTATELCSRWSGCAIHNKQHRCLEQARPALSLFIVGEVCMVVLAPVDGLSGCVGAMGWVLEVV